MFTKVHGSRVTSDEGFEIDIGSTGHDGFSVQYAQGDHFLRIWAFYPQPLPKDPGLRDQVPLILEIPSRLDWQSPKGQQLSDTEQKEVLEKIKAALEFLGENFKFKFEA